MKHLKHCLLLALGMLVFTSSAHADEVTPATVASPIKISISSDETAFSIDSTTAASVPGYYATAGDPLISLAGVLISHMVIDKMGSASERAEQEKKIPNLLKLAGSVNPGQLLKTQLNTELPTQAKWADGRNYLLDIKPAYYLSSSLNTIRMVFKYHLKASKPDTKTESTKAYVYIFHNLSQSSAAQQNVVTWNDVDEQALKDVFLRSATLLSNAFSAVDIGQAPTGDYLIVTTMNDEKIRGYALKQDQEWLWLLDQNKNIYVLRPKRTFVLKAATPKVAV